MSFTIDLQELRDRAAKRLAINCDPATAATPSSGSRVATLAGLLDERRVVAGAEADASQAIGAGVALTTWSDANIAAYEARRARLLRWGWSEASAEATADHLTRAARNSDDRRACVDCTNYRLGRCGAHHAAGLHSNEISRALAALPQRCPAHEPRD